MPRRNGMKEDLDRYLDEPGLDGLLVLGPAAHNPPMTYFTGPVHVGWGALALRRGRAGILYAIDMEREEVARTGYPFGRLDFPAYAQEAGGGPQGAPGGERIRRMGEITVEVVGRVADFLASQIARQGLLTNRQGRPLTVGDVKRRIDLWLVQLRAEHPGGRR